MTMPRATILITTKNRKDELARAVESALAQTVPVEVLVIDDGSTDGTGELVRGRFPQVRYERSEESLGCIRQRSRGVKMASAECVFSIDDDAAFPSPSIVERTLRDLDHPRVGAVAIPYIDVLQTPDQVVYRAPAPDGVYLTHEYRGCAHAVKRDLFARLGGYRDALFFAGEEGDYCLRMLAAGYVTRLGNADPIHHYESARRDKSRQIVFFTRNAILLAWANFPLGAALATIASTLVGKTLWAARNRYLRASLTGAWRGLAGIGAGVIPRRPVPGPVYSAHRWIARRGHGGAAGAPRLEELDARLPPPAAAVSPA